VIPATCIRLAVERVIALVRMLIIKIVPVVSEATMVDIMPEYSP